MASIATGWRRVGMLLPSRPNVSLAETPSMLIELKRGFWPPAEIEPEARSMKVTRIQAHQILDVAADGRRNFDLLLADVGARAHLGGAEHFRTTADSGDLHGVQVGRGEVAGQGGIDGAGLVHAQVDAIFGLGAFTRLGDGDRVRTTHAQAARVVAAGRIGGRTRNGARLGVGDGDFSAGNGLAAAGHDLAADTGRGAWAKAGRQQVQPRDQG